MKTQPRSAPELANALRLALAHVEEELQTCTVREGMQQWLRLYAERRCKPKTLLTYQDAAKRFSAHFGARLLHTVTQDEVAAYLGSLTRGSLPPHFSALSSAMTWLDARGYAGAGDVLPRIHPKTRQRQAYLDEDGYRHWWAALGLCLDRPQIRRRMVDALIVGTLVPFRLAELCSLRWQDVDAGNGIAQIPDGKTGARWIPIGRIASSVLASQPRTGDYVFAPLRPGAQLHLSANGVSHAFRRETRRYTNELGHRWPRGLCFHSLRHSWASLALKSGVPSIHVSRILGHTLAHTTERYAHVISSEVRSSLDSVQVRMVAGLQLQMHIATA